MAAEKEMSPEENEKEMSALKELFDAADAEAEAEGAPDAPSRQEDEMAVDIGADQEGAEEATAEGLDLSPLMETLGATEERAQTLYDAAQQLQKTQGKSPQELSDMIATDFDILMQLEMVAARGEGGAMGPPPAEGAMPAGPEGAPAGEMMPPEGM
jgi:hypothetical protein